MAGKQPKMVFKEISDELICAVTANLSRDIHKHNLLYIKYKGTYYINTAAKGRPKELYTIDFDAKAGNRRKPRKHPEKWPDKRR